jgi:hypothetical protein
MSRQYWGETLAWATSLGTAIATTVTETAIFPTITIPGSYMQDGRVLRLSASGKYGTTGTPTLQFKVKFGAVIFAASGLIVTPSGAGGGASMTAMWNLDALIQTQANGSSGSVMTDGQAKLFTTGVAAGSVYPIASGSTGGTTPVAATADLTVDTALSITATWGTSAAANSLQGITFAIEALN